MRRSSRRAPAAAGRPDRHEADALLLACTVQGRRIVAEGCDLAEARGVRPGIDLAHARALLRDVQVTVAPFTPHEDRKRLRHLARWALRFSPVVAPDPPDGLLLNIHGCAHLFGGEEKLAGRVASALAHLGFPARVAIAPTYAGARAVARHGSRAITLVTPESLRETLADLPVVALRPDPAAGEALLEMGVETIGQLLRLPRRQLAARFPLGLLETLDRALGNAPELIDPVREERAFEAVQPFDGPVVAAELIEATVHRLLLELLRELSSRQQGIRVLVVELRRLLLDPVRVLLKLSRPSGNPAHLWTLLRPKLERLHLGHGVEEVRLHATHVGLVAEEQLALWSDVFTDGRAALSSARAELLDQLMHRLGAQAVTRIEPVESYVPERAFRRTESLHAIRTSTPQAPGHGAALPAGVRTYPAARPSRVLAAPEPVRVIALVPDGPPIWIKRREETLDIVAGVGPERIALPWWLPQPAQTRDYFMVQDSRGRWLWVFRDCTSAAWFLHGEWM